VLTLLDDHSPNSQKSDLSNEVIHDLVPQGAMQLQAVMFEYLVSYTNTPLTKKYPLLTERRVDTGY
jgi:hypothetical protein